jgi:hypothetical protein
MMRGANRSKGRLGYNPDDAKYLIFWVCINDLLGQPEKS